LRALLSPLADTLREAGSSIVIRLDGPLAPGELPAAFAHLTDARGGGRFAISATAKLDAAPAAAEDGSVRIEAAGKALAAICGDARLGIDRGVRLRVFCVPEQMVNPLLDVAELDDERWPEIHEPLLAAGVRSVLGVPTRLGGGPVGTLNVYTAEPRAWDQSERDAIRAFNSLLEGQIASAVALRHHGRVVEQLQYALENRVVIERAIGMLMARDDIDAVTAFARLRRTARSSRRTVAVLARDILEGREGTLVDR